VLLDRVHQERNRLILELETKSAADIENDEVEEGGEDEEELLGWAEKLSFDAFEATWDSPSEVPTGVLKPSGSPIIAQVLALTKAYNQRRDSTLLGSA